MRVSPHRRHRVGSGVTYDQLGLPGTDFRTELGLDEEAAAHRRAAKRELDEAIDAVRDLPGHQDFLRQSGPATVSAAASDAPIVYLAPALVGGTALIADGPYRAGVDLPLLTEAAVDGLVAEYLSAKAERAADPGRWRETLDRVCRRLWEIVVAPLYAAIRPRQAVLVPCGRLGLLPLHAAWEPVGPDDARRHLLDLTTIAYAPSAQALLAARQLRDSLARDGRLGLGRLLAVAEPTPVTGPELPLVACEVAAAARAHQDSTVLTGPGAGLRPCRGGFPQHLGGPDQQQRPAADPDRPLPPARVLGDRATGADRAGQGGARAAGPSHHGGSAGGPSAAQAGVESGGLARQVVAFGEVGCLAGRLGVQPRRRRQVAVALVEVRRHRGVAGQ
ncbi:CHAT domain-containing protein [Streptomyces sp. CB01881]|nr:hypothetical protein C2142_03195 [Streptomyces sp. CB01881]TYC76616.1 CHAT domain-containing protein [Streptomyces sp. CB01881]